MTAPTQTRTSGPMALLKEKRGPLPVWAWVLIGLGVLLAVEWWRRNRAAAAAAATTGDTPTGYRDELPGQQHYPSPIFIVPGATTPPVNVGPIVLPPPTEQPPPPPSPPPPTTPPTTPPAGGSPTPTPPGIYVTVAPWGNPAPWNSTIWGIWDRYRTTASWQQIWNHPMNNSLRSLRGAPENIRPGDKVFVPGAS